MLSNPLSERPEIARLRPYALPGLASALIVLVVVLHYVSLQDLPPGFFSDEAGVALDAEGIATHLRDSHGVFIPPVFQSFGTWRASLFVYAVAAAFRVFGPGVVQARVVASTFSLATAVFLGLLVWRLFRARWLALGAFAVAGVLPWLFTIGRTAFEPTSLPTVLAAFLLLWQVASSRNRWYLGLAAGAALGLAAYAYISAWLFAPLLCAALVIAELPRVRWPLLVATGVGAALVVLPLALFFHGHPDALTSRYHVVSVWQPGLPVLENVGRVWRVYTSGFSPTLLFGQVYWIQGGEMFALLAPALVLGIVALWPLRRDPFWRLVALGLLAAPIPAALTANFSHDLRNIDAVPFYVTLMALGVWRLAPLLRRERVVAGALAGLLAFQAVWFLDDYFTRSAQRLSGWQVAGFGQATQEAVRLAGGGPIVLAPDLYSAESYDPQAAAVPFAFFAGEDVDTYSRVGLAGVNATVLPLDKPLPRGAIVIAKPGAGVSNARMVEQVTLSYPDDWGTQQPVTAFVIWRVL